MQQYLPTRSSETAVFLETPKNFQLHYTDIGKEIRYGAKEEINCLLDQLATVEHSYRLFALYLDGKDGKEIRYDYHHGKCRKSFSPGRD